MVVITLEKCPLALRGDLTKWLQEISRGVYVGNVSARVRDKLWERVCGEIKNGTATMVYSARNEQHLSFQVHNTTWEPIDYDGITLMLRPSPARLQKLEERRNKKPVSTDRLSLRRHGKRSSKNLPDEYVVVDIETTGLDVDADEILEIAAVKVIDGEEVEHFQTLVRPEGAIPGAILRLTGLSVKEFVDACDIEEALDKFLDFIGPLPLVMHNSPFDMGFISTALEQCDMDDLDNEVVDTLRIARSKLPKLPSRSLDGLAEYFGIDREEKHRAIPDCLMTNELFKMLLEV